MGLNDKVVTILTYYVKQKYNSYLNQNNIIKIPDEDIYKVIHNMYETEKKNIEEFIKITLKEMSVDTISSNVMIDNIIYDIFEDKEIAINRATLEIQKYQEQLSNKLNSNKLYTEYLPVNNDSLGLQIDILENDIIIKGISETINMKKIKIGDSILSINDLYLTGTNINHKIDLLKEQLKKSNNVKLTLLTS